MKKTIVILLLLIAGLVLAQWPAPSGLVAYSFFDDHISLEWTPPPPIVISDTLQYDDGTGAREANLDSGMCAMRFTPAARCSVLSIKFNLFAILGMRAANISMYGVNALGLPDYGDVILPTTFNSVTVGWNEIDIGDAGVVVDDEFFVRISKGDTLPEMLIIMDSTADTTDPRSYQYHYMYGWRTLPGDLMIRVEVLYTDTRTRATLVGRIEKNTFAIAPEYAHGFEEPYHPAPAPRTRPADPMRLITPDSYTLYRSSSYGPGMPMLTTVPGSLTTYNDYSVTPGRTYYYTVKADYDSGTAHSAAPDTVAGTAYEGEASLVYDTLLYDDGTPSAGVSYPGAVIANKFHVDTRCKLLAIDYHVSTTGFGSPKFYWDEGGMPGEDILDYGDYLLNTTGWARINVAMENIILDGDFYIGIEMDDFLGISLEQALTGHAWDYPEGGPWTEIPDTNYFIRALIQYADSSAYFHLYPGWNAVSLPIIPHGGLAPSVAFPGAEFVFDWNPDSNAYIAPDNLAPGQGYFVYLPEETSYSITGVPIHMYTLINAGPGWDFIGGLSNYGGVDTTGITEIPDTIITHRIFYYYDRSEGSPTSGSYEIRRRFMPGEAYWIHFNEEGLFELRE